MSKGPGSGRGTEQPPPAVANGTGGHTTAKDDDSGLIDIKNMARRTKRRVTSRLSTESDVEESLLASSRPSALRDVVLPEPGKARPVKLATESDAGLATKATATDGERKGGAPWLAVAAAVVLLGGGAAAWFATRGGGESDDTRGAASEQTVARADTAATTGSGAPPALNAEPEAPEPGAIITDDVDGEPGTDPNADPAPLVVPEPDHKDRKADPKKVAKPDKGDKKAADRRPDAKPDRKSDAPKKTPQDDPPKGDLDSLLDRAAGEKREQEAEKKVADKPTNTGKTTLDRGEIQTGMRSVKGRVAACYETFKQPGTVNVKVTISNTGVVTNAAATGKFKGTDTGACVSKAVSTATFPEHNGPSMSLSYPFLLQ